MTLALRYYISFLTQFVRYSFLLIFIGLIPAVSSAATSTLIFASDMPAQQKQTMLSDLDALNRLQFADRGGSGARLFGMAMTAENLKRWLFERSRYVVPETFNYATSVKVLSPGFQYPNADVMPYFEPAPPPRRQQQSGRVITIMTNMGAHIYKEGKRARNLLTADIAGLGPITINSPRIGLFKVGEGLFMPLLDNPRNSFISFADSVRRLAVYFHEARHSDGNGKSLGFLHSPCPENKGTLGGTYSCDRNQNGPYTVEATFLRSAVDNCHDCNRREKEALRNIYADKFGRVITARTVTGRTFHSIPVDSASDTCKKLRAMNVNAASTAACSNNGGGQSTATPNGAPVTLPELRPAWLDERPEGISK